MIIQLARIACLALMLFSLAACKDMTPKKQPDSASPDAESKAAAPEVKEADIGDAEYAIHIVGTLAESSTAATIKVDVMKDAMDRVNMVTITVAPPAPKPLMVSFKVTSKNAFEDSPVALRAKILRDGKEVDSFSTLLGADAKTAEFEKSVDVLNGLTAPPQTMLVSAQAEIVLLPKGTDPSKVDLNAAAGTQHTTGSVLSNPLRINFQTEGPK